VDQIDDSTQKLVGGQKSEVPHPSCLSRA
jgi:hypothetical protein